MSTAISDKTTPVVPDKPPLIAQMRLPLGYLLIIGAFVVNKGDLRLWALPIVALGSFIRMWSAGTLVKTTELATDGPYALSRNPLYVGTFVASLGLTLMVHDWRLLVFFLVTFILAYRAQILWEEKVLLREHGEPFRRYRQRVARFLPTRWNPDALSGSFSWKRLKANKERAYQVFWLIMVLALLGQAYLISQGFSLSLP